MARDTERRRHDALANAALTHLATTDAERTYYENALEVLWDYGEKSPFEVACDAWLARDTETMKLALDAEERLENLARATRP